MTSINFKSVKVLMNNRIKLNVLTNKTFLGGMPVLLNRIFHILLIRSRTFGATKTKPVPRRAVTLCSINVEFLFPKVIKSRNDVY